MKNDSPQAEKDFQEYYLVSQVARLTGLSESGVRRADREGLIKSIRLGPGGARIFHVSEVSKFVKQRQRNKAARRHSAEVP